MASLLGQSIWPSLLSKLRLLFSPDYIWSDSLQNLLSTIFVLLYEVIFIGANAFVWRLVCMHCRGWPSQPEPLRVRSLESDIAVLRDSLEASSESTTHMHTHRITKNMHLCLYNSCSFSSSQFANWPEKWTCWWNAFVSHPDNWPPYLPTAMSNQCSHRQRHRKRASQQTHHRKSLA